MQNHVFKKVLDARGRRVRGLWRRGDIFYAQMALEPNRTTKVRLHGVETVPQANEAMQALKLQRRQGRLELPGRKKLPTVEFSSMADAYLKQATQLGLKRPATLSRERVSLESLKQYFGDASMATITPGTVMEYAAARRAAGVSGRCVDVDIIALRHVFKKAIRDHFVTANPVATWEPLSDGPKRVRLVSREEIDLLKRTAVAIIENGQQFADYLEILACSGGREQETVRLNWSLNVDWGNGLLGFGQDGLSKFGKARWLPFNPPLEAALKSLRLRAGNSDWLFPARFCPEKHVTTYRKVLMHVMEVAGVSQFAFHHLRHYFISSAVMTNVDFKTIAEWVGHEDGGVLIGRVYGHLTREHSVAQAAKMTSL